MVFRISQEQRQDLIDRMTDNLSAIGFHCFGDSIANAREVCENIEKKAFGVADVASTTTVEVHHKEGVSGDRPMKESMSLYISKAAELMKEECLRRADSAGGKGGGASTSEVVSSKAVQDKDHFDVALDSTDREFYTGPRAEEVLAPLLQPNASFKFVRLSTKSWGIDAAKVAKKAFENLKGTLEVVDLADTIAGRPEVEALKAMEIMCEGLSVCKLKEVDLSDNAFGEKGVRACAKLLQSQSTLEGISFLNNGISEQAARAISELLASPATLKKYHLDKNMTGDEGTVHVAAVLEKATGIEDFKMAGSRFTSDGALMLAKALLRGSSLKKLNLTDNNVNEEGGEAFLEVFKKHSKLEYLNLEATALGEEITGKVTQVVAEHCPDLETLILSANDILREGVDSVAEGIAKMKKLKVLKITDNELGDAGVAKICVALQTSAAKLEELDVSCNEISKSGAEAVSKLAATSLKSTIKKVNLDQNWIQEDAIESIQKIFADAGLDSVLQSLEDNDPDGEPDEDEADEVANLIAKLMV